MLTPILSARCRRCGTSNSEPIPLVLSGSWVIAGDSLAFAGGTASYDPNTDRAAAGINLWVESLLGNRLNGLNNAGVGGDTTADLLARFQTDVIDYAPSFALVIIGVNDVKDGVPVVTSQANYTAMFDALDAAGIYAVFTTINPSILINTDEERAALFTLNPWLIAQSHSRVGLTVVDTYSLVANTGSVTWQSGLSNDGTHQNGAGAFVMGQAVATVIDPWVSTSTPFLTVSASDPFELNPNAIMTGDTAGKANNLTITGGVGAASKVGRDDAIPLTRQQWAQTSGTNTIFEASTTGWSVGDSVVGRVELQVDDNAFSTLYVYVEARSAANAILGTIKDIATAVPDDYAGVFQLNPFTVPVGTASIRTAIRSVGAGTLTVGRMSLRKEGT